MKLVIKNARLYQLACLILFYVLSAFGLIACFVFPTRSFQNLIGGFAAPFTAFANLAIVASGIGAIACLLLHRSLCILKSREPLKPKTNFRHPYQYPFFFYANIALSLVLVVKVGWHLNSPLDIDENIHALSIAQGRIAQELDPINTNPIWTIQNHVIPQLLSIVSTKIFGLTKFTYRLPALLFAILIIVSLFFIDSELSYSPVTTLLLLHFTLNEMTHWYFHSARGYVGMILFTLIPFLQVWKFTRSGKAGTRAGLWLYGSCFTFAVFTHMFGAIFNGILFLSLLFWFATNGATLHSKARAYGLSLLLISMALLPVVAFVLAHNLILLQKLGDLATGAVPALSQNLMETMGISFLWQGKLLILLVAGLVIHGWVNGRRFGQDLNSIFLLASVMFFGICLSVLQTRVFEARYLLAFVAPLVFWIAESLPYLKSGYAKSLGLVATLLTLTVSQAISSQAIRTSLSLNVTDYDYFIGMAKAMTAPIASQCYYFSGKRDLSVWAKEIYFHDSVDITKPGARCAHTYFIHIDPGLRVDPVNGRQIAMIEGGPPPHSRELFRNDSGMSLYEAP